MKFTLQQSSRVKLRRDISELFASKQSCKCSPINCIYLEVDSQHREDKQGQILVSVPKRLFRRAVKRNILKRRLREAYRLNRHILGNRAIRMALIYNSGKEHTYSEIESAVVSILRKILLKIQDKPISGELLNE